MGTIRSSLPLRFRQLLSEQGTGPFPYLKESETTPPKIKAFIDRVIKSPLCDIAIPLSGFRWEYSKGNFHHWRPLFLHFDTYFKTYLSSRKDLQLSDNIFDDDDPFPKHTVLLILRVMQTILENCHNKSSFGCQEHLKLLLTSTDPEVLIATLETLSALVKIIPSKLHVNGKLIGCGSMNSCLLSLAQGWGSKEEGLGLFSCIVANERRQEEGLSLFPSDVGNDYDKSQYQLGTTLHFGFHVKSSQGTEKNSGRGQASEVRVIHIPDLHLRKEDDLTILKQCIDQYGVPPENRFSLLTRIRYTRSFLSPKRCRLYSRICLLAFIVLVQSNDAHEELASFFANEPEYTNDLIRLVQSEDAAPGSIRTLAMLALGAQLAAYSSSHERARILNGSSIISAGGNRMVLLDVLQKVVLSLNDSSDPSSLSFLDALLQFYLLHVISSSSSGGTVRGSGMVPTLLSLVQDVDCTHSDLLFSAVKTLQKLMDYSFAAVSLFKDLGGVELLAHRLQTEVHRVVGMDSENSVSVTTENLSKVDDSMFNSQKRLIRAFLKALGSASYSSRNSTRSQNYYDNSLPYSLSLIFQNVDKFGGDIYFSAVTLMSEIIHKDPTCFSMLHELGLPDAFLSSVSSQILLSSKALTCIPCGLGAICLNSKGLEAVRKTYALRFLVETCTTRKCLLAMNRGVVPLSSAVEELLRHAPTLRSTGVDIIIEIIEKLSLLGKDICTGSSSNIEGGTEMETDPQYEDSSCHEDLLDGADPTADGVSNEQFVRLCIFHVMVLVRRVMENSENCRLFVEKKGIEALMKLLLQPSIVQSPEGMSVALHSTMVFKGFTQHHSTPLAHAFCSSLRDHLKKALSGFSSTGGLFSLDSRPPPDSSMFSPLFVVEFLLFLAASKETRWVSALLAEFANGSKDVLEDIGRVHREVLWQIALLDDTKLELKDDICISCGGSQRLDPNANENDEQRFNFFRRFLDPLMRRRVSGRSVDSQFFDLVSMYHDVSRATGLQHSLGMDGPSSLLLGSGHQLQPSSSSDTGAVGRMEDDTQQSWYSSCCDMMRSLSLHISHLFLELGKVMLAPSHRRDDSLVVSPSAKSVVSTFASIACDHLSFAGHPNPSNREAFISTKCRYLGKVVKFINSILMDRPESYNPLLLNCFYCHGVFQVILTTFEATSQLLFNVTRMSFSPMAIDDGNLARNKDGKIDDSWIYGSLASYGTLMDHLVTSSFIISPFTKHLLCQYITKGNVPVPRDAETFVKLLQSMVLKAVLPIWSHPHFPDCSYDFVTAIVSILRHIYSGVEVKNTNVNARAQMVGPPPDESAISRIVEMGFSRSRAEEALRQVRTNSVEMAMEWLVSHLEDAQEDDELARALAMSLGSSGASIKEDEVVNAVNPHQEEVVIQLPTDDELLLACIRLLQRKEPLVFPVRDLLVMICSQNDGCYRSKVVTFVIDQVKLCSSVSDCNETKLSAYFHVLALVLHEDSAARELAFQHGLVKISLDLLSRWDPVLHGEKTEVPKWVTTSFLAIDQMLQVDPKLNSEILAPEQLKKDNLTNKLTVVSDEKKANSLLPTLGLKCCMDINEQKRLIVIACRCIRSKLPPETMHVVLQLCASLTKIHSIALTFLDAGGLPSLLNLPSSSLFSGFDNVSSAIVRHILEDPQTLQQAMEGEIRHTVVSALSRHSNGRLTPRIFLQNLAFVIARDPSVFMKAAQSVCQIQMAGERPHIVLLKDREKEKCREKDKDKALDKDKQHVADGNDHGKLPDPSTKNVKVHRKPPQSFVSVIELLLDFVINFVPSPNDDGLVDGVYTNPSIAEMDVDGSENKGKGIAIADVSAESVGDNLEASTSLAKIVFILKLLSEILSTYTSSVHVLLRRDAEVNNCRGLPQRGPTANCNGGIIRHILHNLLPYAGRYKKDKKVDSDWRHKLSSRASQFLVTSSTRSTEGRRRVFAEISSILNDFVDSADGYRTPDYHIHAYVDLLNDILVARSPTGPFISAEASTTFIDVGLVRSLTQTLEVLDLDHADSPKIVTGIVKALELVSKEQIHSPDPSSAKGLISMRQTSDHGQPGGEDNGGNQLQSETTSQCNQNEVAPDHVEPSNAVRTHGSSDSITDDMEQEQDMNVCFPPETEDDSMHEASEEAGGIDNGVATAEIRFGIPHNVHDNSVDEDDGTSAEEEDEDEVDDEEENNDFEEDDVHHMSHPDTDQDENEIDEDEFDEDVVEDEDEDDEDDEDGVILRLEEGINGINVFDHIEVFGRENHFSNDTLHVMPVGVFGSRRHGRTTSIYSLLGRNGDSAAPLQHPLLVEPSSLHPVSLRQSGDVIVTDGSLEDTSSRLDVVFRSLRSGRHGHRFNTWVVDDGQQRTGSNVRPIPPGMEELLISQLRRPAPGQSLDHNKPPTGPQDKVEMNQLWDSSEREEAPVQNNLNCESVVIQSPSSAAMDRTGNADVEPTGNDFLQEREVSNVESHATDMQYDRNDAVARDVEAVSQGSSGSGATLGESLRSLEVEIGSADGHDDGGERPLGDLQPTRMRRVTVSLGNATHIANRDMSLHSVNEVSPHPNQVLDQSGPAEEQQINRNTDMGSIDPAFLDALPEQLRVEVLSARQNQAAQPSTDPPQSVGDIDPEFLAALPPDIRAEVLAQQQTQRLQQSQEFEGQPVEMDTVSIIATFPSDLREEVLLTSSDAILANLTPALVAEANMLRERFAHRYHNRTLLGMYPRNRRGESSRRGEAVGSSLDRATGAVGSHRSVGGKLAEADGVPLVDNGALRSMIRLLRVVQLPYKSQLQRLFLNLCAHPETRTSLVQILMDMLMLDILGPAMESNGAVEPSYRLYGCQSSVTYSRPQFLDGVPPLVSRRILENLSYLAQNHPSVARLLLHLQLPRLPVHGAGQMRGKAVMAVEDDRTETKQQNGEFSIVLLLNLLNQPLYLRSVAHLEQLLTLLEVVINNAKSNSSLSNKSALSPPDQPSASQNAKTEASLNTGTVGTSALDVKSSKNGALNCENDTLPVLLSLPQTELRLLCSLLAREGLSENAYVLVAEVLKKLVAIAPTHCHLFITELADSVRSLTRSAMIELHGYGEGEKKLLNTATTDGTAILRVLQALSSLVSLLLEKQKEKNPHLLPDIDYNSALSRVWDINSVLEPLWLELSACIIKIESFVDGAAGLPSSLRSLASTGNGVMPPLPVPPGTQNILPYIESFFVTCEKLCPGQSGATHDFSTANTSDVEDATLAGDQNFPGSNAKADEKHVAFVKFSEKHRKLLNAFIRQNPGLLEKSLSLMLKVPRFIDFDNKRAHFRSKMKHQHDHHHNPLRISVRRAYILEDSYNQLRLRPEQDLKGRLTVHFQGEEGIDAGGLTREWYQSLSRVVFDKGALLFTTVGNESTFQPNPNSVYQTEHLSYFKFIGRVVGKALFDGQLLDVHFTRSFYKHILGVKVTYHDIEAIDPHYFKNLKWMLENDISDVLDLTFSIDADEEKLILYERTEVTDHELIPGGQNIKVTEENKHEYVNLVAEHRLTTSIRPQINAFMEGFSELIPRDLISIFNDKELELLISGLPDIDLEDMRANTEYSGFSAASPVIQWFWEVVQGFSKEDKARLLQFVTGTSKVPLEGFSALQGISGSQRFQIHKAYGSPRHLPSAHTCFNQLDLPEYPSKEQLQERLLLAIHEASEGFGFG